MMKAVVILILILSSHIAFGQTDTASIISSATTLHLDRKQKRIKQIQLLADSINFYSGGKVPDFLLNPCIDWDRSYWQDLHAAFSVRWKILTLVNNKQALKKLLAVNDSKTKLKCEHVADTVYPYLTIPMIEQSFYQLIKKRYRQL